jgi:hypothetical protein
MSHCGSRENAPKNSDLVDSRLPNSSRLVNAPRLVSKLRLGPDLPRLVKAPRQLVLVLLLVNIPLIPVIRLSSCGKSLLQSDEVEMWCL